MKRTLPLLITALAGIVLAISSFIPAAESAGEAAAVWFDILASIAFILGGGNLLRLHLQKISDRRRGWGFSGLTLITFAATLAFGLLKVGVPPEPGVEFYGETFVPFPVSALPVFRVPGTIPTRIDEEPLPNSVRTQLRQEGSDLVFRGWMLPDQQTDLKSYDDTLEWRCAVERLYEASQPPEILQDRVAYYPDHHALSFAGYMTEAERDALQAALPESRQASEAVSTLLRRSREPTTITVRQFPPGFEIPSDASASVQRTSGTLTVLGPVSSELRDDLAIDWCHESRVRPPTPAERESLLTQIDEAGPPLTPPQRKAYEEFFDAVWGADQLVLVLNIAGTPAPQPKSSCELLAELAAGAVDPPRNKPAAAAVTLNDAQRAAVTEFVNDRALTADDLAKRLSTLGAWTPAQEAALRRFLDQQPTVAEQRRELCFALLRQGSLGSGQLRMLLEPGQEQFQWQQEIGRLFVAAHRVKYPWAGPYSAPETPFGWLYQYVFQPLLTTTFAMLAFYVASAAFRAFRAKNLEATLLLGTAFIILLGRTFAGYVLTSWVPEEFSAFRIDQLTVYIMQIFNTAGNRAIMIGIALGIASTSLKVLLGIDRSYLGSGND